MFYCVRIQPIPIIYCRSAWALFFPYSLFESPNYIKSQIAFACYKLSQAFQLFFQNLHTYIFNYIAITRSMQLYSDFSEIFIFHHHTMNINLLKSNRQLQKEVALKKYYFIKEKCDTELACRIDQLIVNEFRYKNVEVVQNQVSALFSVIDKKGSNHYDSIIKKCAIVHLMIQKLPQITESTELSSYLLNNISSILNKEGETNNKSLSHISQKRKLFGAISKLGLSKKQITKPRSQIQQNFVRDIVRLYSKYLIQRMKHISIQDQDFGCEQNQTIWKHINILKSIFAVFEHFITILRYFDNNFIDLIIFILKVTTPDVLVSYGVVKSILKEKSTIIKQVILRIKNHKNESERVHESIRSDQFDYYELKQILVELELVNSSMNNIYRHKKLFFILKDRGIETPKAMTLDESQCEMIFYHAQQQYLKKSQKNKGKNLEKMLLKKSQGSNSTRSDSIGEKQENQKEMIV